MALVVMPTKDKDWIPKTRRFLFYWGDSGEPVRVRNPLEVLKTPAFWMVIGFAVDLTFWVWAATLIDPLVATLVFQLFPDRDGVDGSQAGQEDLRRKRNGPACHG